MSSLKLEFNILVKCPDIIFPKDTNVYVIVSEVNSKVLQKHFNKILLISPVLR